MKKGKAAYPKNLEDAKVPLIVIVLPEHVKKATASEEK